MPTEPSREIRKFVAIVLAGSRGPDDPVAMEAGVAAKALAEVGGTAMVCRVVRALDQSEWIGQIVVVGLTDAIPADVDGFLRRHGVERLIGADSPSRSVLAALDALTPRGPVLVTTADHALLQTAYVDEFCREASGMDTDVAVALATYDRVTAASPGVRRTVSRFSDGGYCGCNMFAFLTARGRHAVRFWRRVEAERKNPVRLIRSLGFLTLARFLLGRLSLRQGLGRLSQRAGAKVEPVLMSDGAAAIDVDSVEDLCRVRAMLAEQETD